MSTFATICALIIVLLACLGGLLILAAGAIAHMGLQSVLARGVQVLGDWWIRTRGGVPWLPKVRSIQVSGATHGLHQTAFVSRHHLAEGGLTCPLCQTRIAEAGDFRDVYRLLVDGRENEVIVCTGTREVGDEVMPCATLLLASPDTEHGDHLGADGQVDPNGVDPPDYYRFVRVDAQAALREKWGVEVVPADGDALLPTDNETDLLAAEAERRRTAPTEPQLPAVKG